MNCRISASGTKNQIYLQIYYKVVTVFKHSSHAEVITALWVGLVPSCLKGLKLLAHTSVMIYGQGGCYTERQVILLYWSV